MAKKEEEKKDVVTIENLAPSQDQIGGSIEMSADVVATIAGLAAREVTGIHSMGKSRLIAFGNDPTRGVGVEVGAQEAALDLEVIVEYGTNIREMSFQLRKKIAEAVDRMAGRKVVEVNINVVDIKLPEEEKKPVEPDRRVR